MKVSTIIEEARKCSRNKNYHPRNHAINLLTPDPGYECSCTIAHVGIHRKRPKGRCLPIGIPNDKRKRVDFGCL